MKNWNPRFDIEERAQLRIELSWAQLEHDGLGGSGQIVGSSCLDVVDSLQKLVPQVIRELLAARQVVAMTAPTQAFRTITKIRTGAQKNDELLSLQRVGHMPDVC